MSMKTEQKKEMGEQTTSQLKPKRMSSPVRNFLQQQASIERDEVVDDGFVRVNRNRSNTADTNIYNVPSTSRSRQTSISYEPAYEVGEMRSRSWTSYSATSSYANPRGLNFHTKLM